MESSWIRLIMKLEPAKEEHINAIFELVNLAYRGDSGWTKETELITGARTTVREVQSYLSDPNAHLLIATEKDEILACICVEIKANSAYIGFFSVHPKVQGKGLGKDILSQAERYAYDRFKVTKYIMLVVSQRIELIAYYERRGYRRTGHIQAYPEHLKVGKPLQADLTIEYLEKRVL